MTSHASATALRPSQSFTRLPLPRRASTEHPKKKLAVMGGVVDLECKKPPLQGKEFRSKGLSSLKAGVGNKHRFPPLEK